MRTASSSGRCRLTFSRIKSWLDQVIPRAGETRSSQRLRQKTGPTVTDKTTGDPLPPLCPPRGVDPTHPCGPGAAPCSSTASVTWEGQTRVSCSRDPTATHPSMTGLAPLNFFPKNHAGDIAVGGGAHLVDAQHRAPERAAQPAQGGPQRLQTPGPGHRGRAIKLAAERGRHGVDDHQAGHPPRQQHRHLLTHTLQQGVLETEGEGGQRLCPALKDPSPPPRFAPHPLPPRAITVTGTSSFGGSVPGADHLGAAIPEGWLTALVMRLYSRQAGLGVAMSPAPAQPHPMEGEQGQPGRPALRTSRAWALCPLLPWPGAWVGPGVLGPGAM